MSDRRTLRCRGLWTVCLVGALAPAACKPRAAVRDSQVWFDDIGSSFELPEADLAALVVAVTEAVFRGSGSAEIPPALRADVSPRLVFISISDGRSPARVVRGSGRGLAAAANAAVQQAQALSGTVKPQWLKLDVVTRVEPLRPSGLGDPVDLEVTLDGLAFDRASQVAFLAEELVGHRLISSKKRLRSASVEQYLGNDPARLAAFRKLQTEEAVEAYRFGARSVFSDGTRVVPMYRGHGMYPLIAPADLKDSAVRAGAYLAQAVESNGRFKYEYRPVRDDTTASYNILRHAGTAYSMFELYQQIPSEPLLEAANRAIEYLVNQIEPAQAGDATAACVVEDGMVKLGGNALAIIALVEQFKVTQKRDHLPLAQRLARWMTDQQLANGRFRVHKMSFPEGAPQNFQSSYYPGEAILALVRLHGVDDDPAWLDAAERAALYLIQGRDAGRPIQSLPHDHWLLYGLNEVHRRRQNPVLLEHARKITQAIVKGQRQDPPFVDWLGSYYNPPRSTPTAIRTEGLCAAYQMFRDFGQPADAAAALHAIRLGIGFQLQTEIRPESAMYLRNPQRALGGYRESLTGHDVRIDYVQHNISALLNAHRLLADSPAFVYQAVVRDLELADFGPWIKDHLAGLKWPERRRERPSLKRDILERSLALGRQFLLKNQKPEGNFNYQYNFIQRSFDPSDSQVRQAGTLWSIALLYHYEQTPDVQEALDRGLQFFFEHTAPGSVPGSLRVAYPGDGNCDTGTVALVSLAIIEYLRTAQAGRVALSPEYLGQLNHHLDGYLAHLKFMRLDDKHFARTYHALGDRRSLDSSPYFDGETLLCLCKAAKYLDRTDLIPLIEETAPVLAKAYTHDAWRTDKDSDQTKGFFQWSCMAFWEYQDAGWAQAEMFGDTLLSLSWWMIVTHRTLGRSRNTAYAYEGIIHAYLLAQARNDKAAIATLEDTIDRGLFKLTSWQVGGPLQSENSFLTANPTDDPLAVGGVMNHSREALLRIDVTQHQMAAVMLALRHVYTPEVSDAEH